MKRILIYLLLTNAVLSVMAEGFLRNPQPAVLEVRYMRTEVTDTTQRETAYYRDEMMLRIGKDMSLFCGIKRFDCDSLRKVNGDAYRTILMSEIQKGNPHVFSEMGGHESSYLYKYYKDNKVVVENFFDMTPWRSTEDWEKPEWDITDESKEILGYECLKATSDFRGRKWTAWFAPEIPVQEGPWKLCGLPGLILEAHDAAGDYSFVGCGLMQNGVGDVGYCLERNNDDYYDVTRIEYLVNWWKYKHADRNAILSAYGVKSQPARKRPPLKHDKEETDYPHDL